MPYFKDIYKDLAARSDKPQKGINRLVFIEVRIFTRSPHSLLHFCFQYFKLLTLASINIVRESARYTQ